MTGTRPALKTTAFERRVPWPLLSKEPLTHNALGMIAAKTGMDSVDALEAVGETCGRQRFRIEPATQIEKCSGNA